MASEVVVLNNGLKVALIPCEAESVAFGLFVVVRRNIEAIYDFQKFL